MITASVSTFMMKRRRHMPIIYNAWIVRFSDDDSFYGLFGRVAIEII